MDEGCTQSEVALIYDTYIWPTAVYLWGRGLYQTGVAMQYTYALNQFHDLIGRHMMSLEECCPVAY